MNSESDNASEEIERLATEWVVRLDRGLSAYEQDEYTQWLARDARHGQAISQLRWGWEELDRLAGLEKTELSKPNPDLLAPKRTRRSQPRKIVWFAPLVLVAAASIVFALVFRRPSAPALPVKSDPSGEHANPTGYERRLLEDGSVVELNTGATITVEFAEAERHVHLLSGEANFIVAKNPGRPFTVDAAGVTVQAVGTVFNIKMESSAVDVVVSEGTVKVGSSDASATPTHPAAVPVFVKAGQHALVKLSSNAPPAELAVLTPEEMAERLTWQSHILDFTDTPLSQIVGAFNAHNTTKLVIGDPALEKMGFSGTFRWDNLDGFVRFLDSQFGVRAEPRGAREIVLLKK